MPDEECKTARMERKRTPRSEVGIDWVVAELASRQHGVVAKWQLDRRGVTAGAIRSRLTLGRLHGMHRGVYAVGHRALDQRSRWIAAVLACGPGSWLSHRSAAQLWGLIDWTGSPPEVTRPGYHRRRDGIRIHRASLPADECGERAGIAVTSPARTLFDLASVVNRGILARALHESEVRGLGDALSLQDLTERHPAGRGAASLRGVLADADPDRGVTGQELEARFKHLVERAGLPTPRFNAELAAAGRFLEVDCMWARERLVVELDGHAVHRTRRAFEADRERDRILAVEGWRVLRITWRHLRDEPRSIEAQLRRLLRRPPTLER